MKRLGTDQGGVVSFEYVIVAACVIAGVSSVFAGGPVQTALTSAIAAIGTLSPPLPGLNVETVDDRGGPLFR